MRAGLLGTSQNVPGPVLQEDSQLLGLSSGGIWRGRQRSLFDFMESRGSKGQGLPALRLEGEESKEGVIWSGASVVAQWVSCLHPTGVLL